MSQFITRPYDAYLFLAAPDATPIWHWDRWQALVQALGPTMDSSRGRTSVRMTQFRAATGGDLVRFGQIGWNEKSHQKWTHQSPVTKLESQNWEFYCAGVWSPGPTTCEREDTPPDSYLTVKNELTSGLRREDCKYSYSLMLALAADQRRADTSALLECCKTLTNAVLALHLRTTWSPDFCNSMTDWDAFGAPYHPGNHHFSDELLSPAILKGEWQKF